MTINRQVPEIEVGVVSGTGLTVTFNGMFSVAGSETLLTGEWTATLNNSSVIMRKEGKVPLIAKEIIIIPQSDSSSFTLHSVTIGVNFHWQRNENQTFKGNLKFFIEDCKVTAVNILSLEEYLVSVISSEMNATSSKELLKAHAVISRSWLMAQIEKNRQLTRETKEYHNSFKTKDEIIRWYDREDHTNFDVCADDHCQRYQGITRASTPIVEEVIRETSGEVLMYHGAICDARFSKCCGGVTEVFENVWEPVNHPYLQKIVDYDTEPEGFSVSLDKEADAERWISGKPDAFCNTNEATILKQVLNDYDQETHDFFRWEVKYTCEELSSLIRERTGIDFGTVTDLKPLERGTSGRIIRLQITGTKNTFIIGKELEIRKALSKTHLYSSAFIVEKQNDGNIVTFRLKGAGWGHGVGLCQIGAAVMGAQGYNYRQILDHYYRGSSLEKRY